jgi:branched-chain amino acid transport system permease protein
MRKNNSWLKYVIIGCFIVALPLFGGAFPSLIHSAVFAGVYTILCLGLNLIFGQAGQLTLSTAAFYGIGAYSSVLLVRFAGVPVFVGIICGTIIAGLIGYLLAAPILRLGQFYLTIATMAFAKIVENVLTQEVEITGGPTGIVLIPKPSVAGFTFENPTSYYYLVWGIAIIVFLISRNIVNSKVGRGLRALATSETGASSMGVHTYRYKNMMFSFGALFAGLAGALYAHFIGYISPDTFTVRLSISVLVMVAIGGKGNLWGGVFGAIFIAVFVPLFGNLEQVSNLLYGGLLLIILMFLPGGLSSLFPLLLQKIKGPERIQRL